MTRPRRPPPVLLLWGEDPFLLREAALEALGGVRPREVEGGAWAGGELADLATPSLFGEGRALLVTEARALPEAAHRELAAYLAAPSPDAWLVLCATVPERGKPPARLVRLVQGVGEVREVRVPRKDLAAWVLARARGAGVDLAPDAAQALVETVGEDPGALDQAVRQLGSAFPGERVGRDLVLRQFRGLGEQHVWDLCDRAFGRDLPGAIRALRSLLEARGDPLLVVGGIAARLRELVRVRALPERMPPAELARAAGLRFEWQARRLRDQARRFRMEELATIHAEVVEADRALKSGAPEDVVLAALVAAIAGGD
ncbi:MAG TPA: DNA polymerase III subunit delta [Actinomycetota bacterium]|nr:DNA polymerase III subunit delta [Actinomycetota bacterium]